VVPPGEVDQHRDEQRPAIRFQKLEAGTVMSVISIDECKERPASTISAMH
jgi:hypothetical protein